MRGEDGVAGEERLVGEYYVCSRYTHCVNEYALREIVLVVHLIQRLQSLCVDPLCCVLGV